MHVSQKTSVSIKINKKIQPDSRICWEVHKMSTENIQYVQTKTQ